MVKAPRGGESCFTDNCTKTWLPRPRFLETKKCTTATIWGGTTDCRTWKWLVPDSTGSTMPEQGELPQSWGGGTEMFAEDESDGPEGWRTKKKQLPHWVGKCCFVFFGLGLIVLGFRFTGFEGLKVTQKGFYTKWLLHKRAFTQKSFYTRSLLHRRAFTQNGLLHKMGFYTNRLLHKSAFTQNSFYTEELLHKMG